MTYIRADKDLLTHNIKITIKKKMQNGGLCQSIHKGNNNVVQLPH